MDMVKLVVKINLWGQHPNNRKGRRPIFKSRSRRIRSGMASGATPGAAA